MRKSSKKRIQSIHERDQAWMAFDSYTNDVLKICDKIDKDMEHNVCAGILTPIIFGLYILMTLDKDETPKFISSISIIADLKLCCSIYDAK